MSPATFPFPPSLPSFLPFHSPDSQSCYSGAIPESLSSLLLCSSSILLLSCQALPRSLFLFLLTNRNTFFRYSSFFPTRSFCSFILFLRLPLELSVFHLPFNVVLHWRKDENAWSWRSFNRIEQFCVFPGRQLVECWIFKAKYEILN